MLKTFQSGFRQLCSTETALAIVSNDLLIQGDAGECSVLILLSAAFDTVDHHILIERLRQCLGIPGLTLDLFSSYLSERTFLVTIDSYA